MREVRAHMRSRWRGPVDETVRRAEALFDEIDITGDGIITQQEYYKALELAVPRAFTPEEREVLWCVVAADDGSHWMRQRRVALSGLLKSRSIPPLRSRGKTVSLSTNSTSIFNWSV